MEFRELLTGCRNKKFPAKAQSCKEKLFGKGSVDRYPEDYHPGRRLASDSALALFTFAPLRLCGKLLLPILLLAFSTPAQRRPLTPPDILRIANVSDAQISPAADWAAYTVATVEGDATRST